MGRTARTVVVGVLLALAIAVPVAPAGAAIAQSHSAGVAKICQVNGDGVHYREGPGTQFKALGTVNRGQKYDVYRYDNDWANGTVVGVIGNVWIHKSFLTC